VGVVNANKRNKLIISVDLVASSWLMLAALVLFHGVAGLLWLGRYVSMGIWDS